MKKFICAIICLLPLLGAYAEMTDDEKKSLALANYFSVQTQKIVANDYNRVVLDEAYNDLLNNLTFKLDDRTEEILKSNLDSINDFRNISFEREHLNILFENAKAQAINQAMPNPMYLLSTIMAGDLKKTLAACAMMTLDSISNYQTANTDAIIENLEESWKLDKDERNTIVDTHKAIISYLVNVANKNENIGDFDLLSQAEAEDYVKHAKLTNNYQKRQFLVTNQDDYKYYGPYWGLLAKTSYELGEYEDCLNAINEYEKISAKIFKIDHELAEVLPCVIISLENVYKNDPKKLEKEEVKYLQLLEENVEKDNWNARYFISQMYISLSALTKNNDYLKKAYEITKNDLNTTTIEQETWIANYLKPVDESISKLLTKSELKKRKAQIKREKELKSKQFIPYHEGFYQNYLLYSDLCEKLDIPEKEKETMRQIYNFALSVYMEKYYVGNTEFEDEIIDLAKSIKNDIEDVELWNVIKLFKFRKTFDIKTESDSDLMKEIISSYKKNYYLPSIYETTCTVNKKTGILSIKNLPACLLNENTIISAAVFHFDENEEVILDYEVENLQKDLYFIDSVKSRYKSYDNSPVYFMNLSAMWFKNKGRKLEINQETKYYVSIILENEGFERILYFVDPFDSKNEENFFYLYDSLSDEDE